MNTHRAVYCFFAGLSLSLIACSAGPEPSSERAVAANLSGLPNGGTSECPVVNLPRKEDCPNGEFVPEKDDTGCTRGFRCVTPGCVDGGTECPVVNLPRKEDCPNGEFVPRKDAHGCTVAFDCVEAPGCPPIALPPADSCQGQYVPKVDATGCTRDFECLPCPPEPMIPEASSCPNGVIVPKRNGNVCVVGYECITGPTCPNVAAQPPISCAGGAIVPRYAPSGCVTGLDCLCHLWSFPPPDFCPQGQVPTTKTDQDSGCVVGIFCE